MRRIFALLIILALFTTVMLQCQVKPNVSLNDEQIRNIVQRSYQYVALFNVNNKFAMDNARRTGTNGWNICVPDTALKDHTLKSIARPILLPVHSKE